MNINEKDTTDDVNESVTTGVTDHLKNRNVFAIRLKECLPEGMSQQEAADTIGVSISGFKKWLKGTTEPSIAYLPAIEALTGRSVQWLVTGEERAQELSAEGLDPDLMQLVLVSLCEHLQKRKVWADVKPEDVSKLSLVLYRLTRKEIKEGQKRIDFEAHSDIIKVILG